MGSGRIVLVLHTLAGASELKHISAGFCLPGTTASLEGFLLSERVSLHCRVCLHIASDVLEGRLAAHDIIQPREGGLRYWETWCQMRCLGEHNLQLCSEWGLKCVWTAAIACHQKSCDLSVISRLLCSWWGSLESKMSLQLYFDILLWSGLFICWSWVSNACVLTWQDIPLQSCCSLRLTHPDHCTIGCQTIVTVTALFPLISHW